MTPYYDEDGITIYHGDCREILPGLTGDVVLTDYPYGIGVDYGAYSDTPDKLEELIGTSLPLLQQAAPVVALTCGIANIWRFPPARWVLCWYQSNAPTATGGWGFNQWQPVLVYGTDPFLRRGLGRRSDAIAVGASGTDLIHARNLGHPCPKPMGSWRRILLRVSPAESDVIIDPFMGSGTTLVVAKYSGRRAIGVELDERYCEIAAKRLSQGVLALGG